MWRTILWKRKHLYTDRGPPWERASLITVIQSWCLHSRGWFPTFWHRKSKALSWPFNFPSGQAASLVCVAWSLQNLTNFASEVRVGSSKISESPAFLYSDQTSSRQFVFCDTDCPFNASITGVCVIEICFIKIDFSFPLLNIKFYFLLWNQMHSCVFLQNMFSPQTWTKCISL